MIETRICVIGDELVAGVGDPRALGWVGRVMARSQFRGPSMQFTLAVPGETTSALSARWEAECGLRFGPHETCDNRLVVAVGRGDAAAEISPARSRLNLANILDRASYQNISTFVVGPPPGDPADGRRLQDLSSGLADVASRRHVPYVDAYTPLVGHEQWLADLGQNRSVYPGQAGYGLIAWLVLHTGWHDWLGIDSTE